MRLQLKSLSVSPSIGTTLRSNLATTFSSTSRPCPRHTILRDMKQKTFGQFNVIEATSLLPTMSTELEGGILTYYPSGHMQSVSKNADRKNDQALPAVRNWDASRGVSKLREGFGGYWIRYYPSRHFVSVSKDARLQT